MKYLIALIISNLICQLFALFVINLKPTILLVLFMVLPIILISICLHLRKSNNIQVLELFIGLTFLICSVLFWTDDIFRTYVIIDEYSITALVFLIINIIFALVLPRTKPNSALGLRNQMTRSHPDIWKRTHRFMSYLITASWIPLFLLIFYLNGGIGFLLSLLLVLFPSVIGGIYSGIIGGNYLKSEDERDKEALREQIEKEESGYRIQGRNNEK